MEETKELISETRARLKQDVAEVKTRFQQRVGDIAFWKSELDLKLAELKEAIDEVECHRDRINHALTSKEGRIYRIVGRDSNLRAFHQRE